MGDDNRLLTTRNLMAIYCANCGVELPDGVAFCDACGTPVRAQNGAARPGGVGVGVGAGGQSGIGATACPVCGAAALPGEAFCDNCGAALLAPTTYIAPTQVSSAPASSSQRQVGAPPSYSSAPMGGQGYSPAATREVTAALVVTSPPPPH